MPLKVTVCVLVVIIGSAFGSNTISPNNVTAKIGESVRFQCFKENRVRIMSWNFNDMPLYIYQYGVEDPLMDPKKYLITKDHHSSTLTIKDLSLGDGGIVSCDMDEDEAHSILVVLDQPQITKLSASDEVGSVAIYTCEARFGGPSNHRISPDHFPQLSFYLPGEAAGTVRELDSIHHYTLKQTYSTTITSGMNGTTLVCEIKTLHPELSVNSTVIMKVKVSEPVSSSSYTPYNETTEPFNTISESGGVPMPTVIVISVVCILVVEAVAMSIVWRFWRHQRQNHRREVDQEKKAHHASPLKEVDDKGNMGEIFQHLLSNEQCTDEKRSQIRMHLSGKNARDLQ